ncbi:tripartite tricarboxylate transporter permease [Sinorhizobium sp. RAC02]|uniref:tripartite tricarboxylate transporter permease n=1 Tax=Sinorhizobium sp. RAC02 TaxID=1842534 RepID=UPI00083D45D1|nr:tripartite tricarboxylate transporter permease [Sinorhizobium sp. RAC02]AOF93379.1 tripartite tricarboxylate transporter TctA family protein [Sinorhizobium sp. RAC02]
MDLFSNLLTGFATSLQPANLLYCFVGVVVGTAIGVLPGLGPLATISMLLPLTYALDPVSALIMLSGIYYGAQYGGSTTAILVNLPGEASSVVTAIDGHKMAQAGRAGAALALAALASVFAGTVCTFFVAGFSPLLATVALSFGPAEYFALMIVGLVAAIILAHGSLLKAIGMVLVGLVLGSVGIDNNSGAYRFTFGSLELSTGIEFVSVAMGLFAFADIIAHVGEKTSSTPILHRISRLWPSKQDFREATPAAARGTLLGSVLGILPGGGAALASFSAYTLEKKVSKHPERFGNGAVEGVAGPEAANNAAAQTSFIPMLTLGIPSNGTMALMMGAMMIHNIAPGPQVITQQPVLFWGLITSMFVGNVMLVLLNLPLVGIWVKLISVPYRYLYPAILVFCVIGLYSIQNQTFEIMTAAVFGFVGYLFMRMKCEPAPLLLGFILGPMLESNLKRAMLLAKGDATTFVTRPLSAILLLIAVLLMLTVILPQFRKKREEVFTEEA